MGGGYIHVVLLQVLLVRPLSRGHCRMLSVVGVVPLNVFGDFSNGGERARPGLGLTNVSLRNGNHAIRCGTVPLRGCCCLLRLQLERTTLV
jgi:hypothetical protein